MHPLFHTEEKFPASLCRHLLPAVLWHLRSIRNTALKSHLFNLIFSSLEINTQTVFVENFVSNGVMLWESSQGFAQLDAQGIDRS